MIEVIKREVTKKLNEHPKRLEHVFGVYETAIKLASIYHVSQEKAGIAALFHDYTKYDSLENQIKYLDLKTIKKYTTSPVMFHALSAAEELKLMFKVSDEDILNAIRYHVYGRASMSIIEQIIFISDYCEPNRKFTDTQYIYDLASQNLNQATEYCMKLTIDDVRRKGLTPHEEQVEAYTYYQEVNRGKTK
jgi:predicted HD superfamily hydrolase involved in NAD metabolism